MADEEELRQRRQVASRSVYDQFFEQAEQLCVENGVKVEHKDGKIKVSDDQGFPWVQPLAYALENKAEFGEFINDTGVETTNNASESCLRRVAWARNNMLFTATADGYRAYADLLTIIGTCEMNGVNPYTYLLWALDNAKLRLEIYRNHLKDGNTKELLKRPQTKKVDGKRTSMYDPEYRCWADLISWEGLDVYTYLSILEEEYPRRKEKAELEEDDEE